MIATFWSVAHGPWPAQEGPDTEGFRSAVDILAVMERRMLSGEADAADRTRYRIACATLERAARTLGTPLASVEASDLLAWWAGSPLPSYWVPEDVPEQREKARDVLAGSGPLAECVDEAFRRADAASAGVVITLGPTTPAAADRVVRPTSRPNRPTSAPRVRPNPDLASAIADLPRTADLVFADNRRRLRSAETLRRQIRAGVETGEPLPVGTQARHEVITEVLRELHAPMAPAGALRILYAMEAVEGSIFTFAPLRARPVDGGSSLHVGLMSLRHTTLDPDRNGYWFRNRLVSVPGRPAAESEAYCYRDSVPRLQALAAQGITDLHVTHTGYEPAALGFYRAVAAVVSTQNLRVWPHYLIGGGVVDGTPWPAVIG